MEIYKKKNNRNYNEFYFLYLILDQHFIFKRFGQCWDRAKPLRPLQVLAYAIKVGR